MVSRILYRCVFGISHAIRVKPVGNEANNRLLFKTNKNSAHKTISRNFGGYDCDGKTVGVVINKKYAQEILIHSFTSSGFFMPAGEEFVGSIIIFPHTIMSWNVSSAKEVNEDSLILFKLLEPKLDILVFGYGNSRDYTPEVRQKFTKSCKNLGIRFEALPTVNAVGTYNFLASERRFVAAALIPPKHIDVLRFDRRKPLYLEDGEEDEDEELKAIDDATSKKKLIK